jgi:gentisate 1,2-dioxygenase
MEQRQMEISAGGDTTQLSVGKLDTMEKLYQRAAELSVTPGWMPRPLPIMAPLPRSSFLPAIWHYTQMRDALEQAGPLIDVELAERRNLVLCNPAPDNDWPTSRTLVCAYQMILPGERAPSHRHSSNALRFIIEGKGTYSTVEGEKILMETGDVVLTPGGYYHGHGHDGSEPAYWLDCLDVPLTRLFETSFFETHPDRYETIHRVVAESPFRVSGASIARELDGIKADVDGHRGPRLCLKTTGMPSLGLNVERLPSGFTTRRHRSSANRIYSVMRGRGISTVDGTVLQWTAGDTFVVPANYWAEHTGTVDSQLLEMTDEPLIRFANHYVESFA